MILKDAKEMLPKFLSLRGFHSNVYGKKIQDIYIGFIDQNLTHLMRNPNNCHTVETFDPQPNDYGNHTLCVQFEDGTVEGVRNLVETDLDNLMDLNLISAQLDYMTHSPNDIPLK